MAEKGFFIANLPRDGAVTFLALVREKELKPKRNGGVYLHLVLADRTGEVDAKAWEGPQETAALFERDDIVKVRGTIELYSDQPQLIIQRIRRCETGEFKRRTSAPRPPAILTRCLASCVRSPSQLWMQTSRACWFPSLEMLTL